MKVNLDRPQEGQRELRLKVRFDPDTLRLEHTLIGVIVHLDDCPTAGPPGAPALPMRVARIALPRGMRAAELVAETRATTRLTDAPVPLAPIQRPRPGATAVPATAYGRPQERQEQSWQRRCASEDDRRTVPEPYPVPPYVAPDPELYAAAARAPAVRLIGTDEDGATAIATIAVRPVRIAAEGHLEFDAEIDVTIVLEPGKGGGDEPPAWTRSRAQALRDVTLMRRAVINSDEVFDYSHFYPYDLLVEADYLIVTDNHRWNRLAQKAVGAASGDIVGHFERLAEWKRQRGVTAKVVTITDIVAGRWGDFRSGSRDLQETIRNFLKMAQAEWGVAWVLIGGDTAIVPIRHAFGGSEGEIILQSLDPPPADRSVWAGDHLRMCVANPGAGWEASVLNLLVRIDDGRLIPHDFAGTSSETAPGWYFTTGEDYAKRRRSPTHFVRVNGPADLVNADLQFLYKANIIPTDLYYSSLVGPGYDRPGLHDWDLLDNRVYGQAAKNNELDGINYTPSVSLGRAPVNRAADAKVFVDKVIAYEKFERPDGTPLDGDWPDRAVLVSENWSGRLSITRTHTSPPGPDHYHHPADSKSSLIHLPSVRPDWKWSLLCRIADDDVRLLPYRTDAQTAGRGWYFAASATNLSPNGVDVSIGFGPPTWLPLPSAWLAVFGAPEELEPEAYIFNNKQLDRSLADQEKLRAQLNATLLFGAPRRLYEDVEDMTPAQLAAGPVEVLSSAKLGAALDAGPHIVSLSGHGNPGGCCRLDRHMAANLQNGSHTFIAYADSCSTSQFDGNAMSEALMNNRNGGAVAYVGNTRFSWIGVGDDFQRLFFKAWAALGGNAHLGLLADTRAAYYDIEWPSWRWAVLSLNLLGCPEMPLWPRYPQMLSVPELHVDDRRLRLRIDPDPLDPPFPIDPVYREEWELIRVHLRQGDREQAFVVRGDRVDVPLSGFRAGPATVTIARAGHKPVVREIRIARRLPVWLLLAGLVLVGLLLVALLIVTR